MFKYIGESAHSAHERGAEHLSDLENFRTGSHLLKHIIEHHPDTEPEAVKFNMKVSKFHKSAYERQIHEAVQIEVNSKKNQMMNSKSEYSRCALPRLGLKFGF